MGTGCPPPVYVRVRRYGWRRREHAWTGGRVHRGPGAIATMMHAAARFKAASRRSRGIIAAGGQALIPSSPPKPRDFERANGLLSRSRASTFWIVRAV